jgi:hypothetical protein
MESTAFPLSVASVSVLGLSVLAYLVRRGLHSECMIPGVGSVDLDVRLDPHPKPESHHDADEKNHQKASPSPALSQTASVEVSNKESIV